MLHNPASGVETGPSWGCAATSASAGARVGQQGHLPRVADRGRDLALLLRGQAGHPTRTDLPAVRDERPQQRDVLPVDVRDPLGVQRVDLALRGPAGGRWHDVLLLRLTTVFTS